MKTSNYIVFIVISAFVLIGVVKMAPVQVFASDATVILPSAAGSNSVEQAIPASTGSNGNDAGAAILPSTGGSNGNDAGVILPVTGGSNGNDAGVILPVTGGSNNNEGAGNSGTPADNGGGNTTPPGGSSGSSGSFSGGSSSGSPVLLSGLYTGTSTCPLITTYMKTGANNNASDVAKLQAFLKNILGINLIVNGHFDQATENAVRAFQSKYMIDVMGPWGATQSSGFVYITTLKQINKIACNSPFALSAADMSIINAYKARLNDDGSVSSTPTTGPVLDTGSSTSSTSTDIGLNADGSQTASVGNASILSRFWSFILSLFR